MKIKLFQKLLSQSESLSFTQSQELEETLHKKYSLESLANVLQVMLSHALTVNHKAFINGVFNQIYSVTVAKVVLKHSMR